MRLNETVPQISLSELLRKLSELGGSDLAHHHGLAAAGSSRRASSSARRTIAC